MKYKKLHDHDIMTVLAGVYLKRHSNTHLILEKKKSNISLKDVMAAWTFIQSSGILYELWLN